MSCCSQKSQHSQWSGIDREIDLCLESLLNIRHSLKAEERNNRHKLDARGDQFVDLKGQIVARLTTVRTLLDYMEGGGVGKVGVGETSDDAQTLIRQQAMVRENMRQLGEEVSAKTPCEERTFSSLEDSIMQHKRCGIRYRFV